MPLLEDILAMLGLHAACNPEDGGSEQLFALNREAPNFPSLDQFSAACPALPRIRDLQKAIDTGYKNFTRSWGDLIESFFNPFLDFLIWTENLLVSTPWWLTLVVITAIVYLMTRQRLHTAAVLVVLSVIGVFGMWDDAMRTLSFILVCTLICILFGIPIGVLMARHSRMRNTVTPRPGRHADDAELRVSDPGRHAVRGRQGARRHRGDRLRHSACHSSHRSGYPLG